MIVILSESLQKLGPTWIKMGQFLSTRPDVIGKELSDQLRELQDNLPAFDKKYVEEFLTLSFGKDYKKILQRLMSLLLLHLLRKFIRHKLI